MRRRAEQPVCGGRAVDGDGAAGDGLVEPVEADDIAECGVAVGGEAEFLAPLVLAGGDALRQLDGQAGVVAVVGGVPVPEAPGGDRGEGGGAEVPIGGEGDAAFRRVDGEIGVDVDRGGRRCSCSAGRRSGRRRGRDIGGRRGGGRCRRGGRLGCSSWSRSCSSRRRGGGESAVRRGPEQLGADGGVGEVVVVFAGDGVVEDAVAEGAERGEADGEFVGDQRPGDRGAGLDEIVAAVGEFAVRFPVEGRLARA